VAGRLERVVPEAQVEELELVSRGWLELRLFDVNATYPITFGLQTIDQMMADETSGTCN
jgi:hypothetical protein